LWKEWKRLAKIDFRSLNKPNPNWERQTTFDKSRIDMMMACLFHYDLNLVSMVLFCGGNYIGAHRDPDIILPRVHGLLPPQVYQDLKRIYTYGCPALFNAEGTWEQFRSYMAYGNHRSFDQNQELATATLNKEDK
jgi:hypothetical protein